MRVVLSKRGGIAAGIRMPEKTVDTAALSSADAAQLRRLVQAAINAPLPAAAARGGADPVSYSISIEDGARTQRLAGSDAAQSRAFGELVDWLEGQGD